MLRASPKYQHHPLPHLLQVRDLTSPSQGDLPQTRFKSQPLPPKYVLLTPSSLCFSTALTDMNIPCASFIVVALCFGSYLSWYHMSTSFPEQPQVA